MELVRQIPLNPPLSKGEKGDLTDKFNHGGLLEFLGGEGDAPAGLTDEFER